MEDNNFVRAVIGGGEMDDRESWVIEDEMDGLRMGGCPIHQQILSRQKEERENELTSES